MTVEEGKQTILTVKEGKQTMLTVEENKQTILTVEENKQTMLTVEENRLRDSPTHLTVLMSGWKTSPDLHVIAVAPVVSL